MSGGWLGMKLSAQQQQSLADAAKSVSDDLTAKHLGEMAWEPEEPYDIGGWEDR